MNTLINFTPRQVRDQKVQVLRCAALAAAPFRNTALDEKISQRDAELIVRHYEHQDRLYNEINPQQNLEYIDVYNKFVQHLYPILELRNKDSAIENQETLLSEAIERARTFRVLLAENVDDNLTKKNLSQATKLHWQRTLEYFDAALLLVTTEKKISANTAIRVNSNKHRGDPPGHGRF